jgi:TolB protein
VFQNIERTKFNIRVIDVAQRKIGWVTNDLFNNLNPVWSQSGKFIYFSSDRSGGYNVWRIQVSPEGTAAGSPQQLTTGAGQDVELAASPGGKRLALSVLKQNADIWKLPVSPETGKPTGMPQEVIITTREDSRGSWSPDGTTIAFNSDRGGEMNLWLYSLSDGSKRQLTKGAGGDFQPTWSSDGKRIVFFSSRSGNADIWTVDVETGNLKQLTHENSIDVNPFFSPDSKYVAYQSDRTGRPEVWVMDADGGAPRQLTRVGVRGHFLRWNKTGDAIIFRCPYGDKPRTLQVPLDGGEPRALADVTGGSHMSFSPDYTLIMDVLGHKALWVSPVVSGQPQKVFEFTDKDVRIDYPVWSPDGKWVLFDRFRPQGGDVWMMENFE